MSNLEVYAYGIAMLGTLVGIVGFVVLKLNPPKTH